MPARLELGATGGVCDIVDLNTVSRVDVDIDINRLEDTHIRYVFFDKDFVYHILLVDRVEDVGRRLRSELCGTDEQHRDKAFQCFSFSSIFK
jgi:hypothetical protein